ncbi:nucleotidyltransferase domain-containing protein [Bradyrhizobium guangdongense]|uniref:nucleotidyltransferase domain-containing protein n=1 Tax=Bradyrhizobium guangdongense TaxID=1325090 RepID=UPI001FD53B29|nr:nucleotidyltransferase [Bradyrhizobium guangdongense]MCG2641211.1 nucleotidyltransferase [Bradyrhizobium zhengyangense]
MRKAEVYSLLDQICQALELTAAQLEAARTSYEAVAEWLSGSDNPLLKWIDIYAHGSTGLGTTVKPIGREDFDVDLICKVLRFTADRPPAELKRIVGDRLKENARYAAMLEEKKRCWRLNYAREYHLDISPTINNAKCANGGELVPDKKLREFKPTNPKGYKALFERRAALIPTLRMQKALAAEDRAAVEPFPVHGTAKGILRRTVQILKRHRDVHFLEVVEEIAPISIIITTLAAQSYEYCVKSFVFDSELDVLIATIRLMPHFIDKPVVNGRRIYVVANETTVGENFAERWNTEPARAAAFYEWHAKALADFEALPDLQGIDVIGKSLEGSLGSSVVRKVIDARTDSISQARTAKKLYVAPTVGLTLSSAANATPVRSNTFFGD